MMRTPTEYELQQLMHVAVGYDPVKAHEYYEKHKKLKGRRKGQPERSTKDESRPKTTSSQRGSLKPPAEQATKAQQRKELAARIQSLQEKLKELEAKIREMEHEAASEDRKSKAKKERAAKEKDKPKTAAEKAQAARDAKKYRDEHKQELKTKAKQAREKSGGSTEEKQAKAKADLDSLKALATKVKGQIAVAKQKLAAL